MSDFPRKADGRRIFTAEFKRGVVQQIVKGEKTLAEVSRELDIQPTVMRRWKGHSTSARAGWPDDEEREELRRLCFENRQRPQAIFGHA